MVVPDSETLERTALEDLHRAALRGQVMALGLNGLTIGSAFVSIAGHLPPSAIVINRALGLGLSEPESQETTRAILTAYGDENVARYFIQLHPEAKPPALVGWLESADLVKARGWQKFSRGREQIKDSPTDLAVREVGQEYGEAFGRIVCAGFDLGDEAVPWLAMLPGRDGWHIFMSFDNGEPAGAGALFVHEGLAWMDFAATLPKFRRRGSQGAVLASRVALALNMGCRRMFTCTGVDVAGGPQHSYRNILKAGFREDYVRENYAPGKRPPGTAEA
jgi:GNAT superfamily N-acetyltransferase